MFSHTDHVLDTDVKVKGRVKVPTNRQGSG